MVNKLVPLTEFDKVGDEMYGMMAELFPICRSITGEGVRQTLKILQKRLPLKIVEIPSGTLAFDWTIPEEWNINDAYILDPDGKKIVDFKKNNLHILGYSEPVDVKLTLSELKRHLYSLPEQPDAIPYLTSYYKKRWGFCLCHKDLIKLKEGIYTVKIDSKIEPGCLTFGECIIPGEEDEEVLLSCYICHPSMANDSISGAVLTAFLGQWLATKKRRFSYRLIFIPETIGAIAYLSLNKDRMLAKTYAGLVTSFVGDSGFFRYKKSRRGNSVIDRVAEHTMKYRLQNYKIVDYYPHLGSDERQYCSPGFNLPVGLLTRSPYMGYPEYHTSLDNMSFVSAKNLAESFSLYADIFSVLEMNRIYVNQVMFCEPQLSKRDLYSTLGSQKNQAEERLKLQWILNYSDGNLDLLSIAEKMGVPIGELGDAVVELVRTGLIKEKSPPCQQR
tara:strand:- start:37 stop:1371 length:1335 start_codon:yes stop_codon:yes gene_type:complete